MSDSKVIKVFRSIPEIFSILSPVAGVVSFAASHVLTSLNSSDSDELENKVVGLDKIAHLLDCVADGSLDKDNLYSIADELRQINLAFAQFQKIIS